MKNVIIISILFVIFIIQSNITYAQNSYIYEGSIGKDTTSIITEKGDFPFYPIKSWVGKRFIFLPTYKSCQKYGYQLFSEYGKRKYNGINYNDYVGRIAKVISVKENNKITFKMEDTGLKLFTTAFGDSIDHIALVSDIDNARSKWIGKTLWFTKNKLSISNKNTGEFKSFKIKKYSLVKVINVVCSTCSLTPVRFILKTFTNKEGFNDVCMSGTNASNTFKFEKYFLTKDPKKTYKWSNKIWSAIEKEKIFIGMTAKQVDMSWGKPKSINKTINQNTILEQWVYESGSYAYFENKILTSIQN